MPQSAFLGGLKEILERYAEGRRGKAGPRDNQFSHRRSLYRQHEKGLIGKSDIKGIPDG
jgi:hypothetical protein